MRTDHAVLVEQRQLALQLQHALDHEHHVRSAGVIFVEAEADRMLDRPGQNAFAEFGHLLAVLQHDRILADEIDAADMQVQVDAHARPVQPRGDLFDMRRFAGAVIALDHHAPVVGEAREDGERRLAVEHIGGVDVGHVLVRARERGHRHGHVEPERVAHVNHHVGGRGRIKTVRSSRHSSFRRFPQEGASAARGEAGASQGEAGNLTPIQSL